MTVRVFLAKAEESLASAENDFASGRYNSCANRCYYACFNAARAALLWAGITPRGPNAAWGHAYIQAEFARQLIERRKVYPASLRDVLVRTAQVRQTTDYDVNHVSRSQALRALRLTREFMAAVRRGGTPS